MYFLTSLSFSQIKFKQEANNFLKQTIDSLEKELESMRIKTEAYRRSSSIESFEMKKRIFELENLVCYAYLIA